MGKRTVQIVILLLLGLTVVSAGLLSMPGSYADTTTSVPAAITISPTCMISSNNTLPHTASVLVGNEGTEIGNTTMTVACNDDSGSAVYAVGFSNDTLGTTNLIDANTNSTIPTGTGTSSSNWSMKLSVPSGNTTPTIRSDASYDFSDYEVVPNSYSLAVTFPSSSDGVNNSSFSITYRAYIGGAQLPGTYVGKVKYILVHPNTVTPANTTYTISYNANGGSGVMSNSSNVFVFDDFVLPTSSFTAPNNYHFKGWCTAQNTNQTPQTSCPGTSYTERGTIAAETVNSGNTLILYAVWERETMYMQDMTLADCQVNVGTGGNSANIGDNITVYDKRKDDGNNNYASDDDGDYTIRYINGQCWMTQNLRIAGTISATYSNFTGNDFNVSAHDLKTEGGSGGACNGYYDGFSNACSHTPDSTDLSSVGNGATATTVGRWYNYYAATAGTISTTDNSTEATSDICPAGWKLPTGPNSTENTDFNILFGNTSTNWQTTTGLSAFGAVPAGTFNNGYFGETAYGYWWSATARNYTFRYHMRYNSDNGQFSGEIGDHRYFGYSMRCVMSS